MNGGIADAFSKMKKFSKDEQDKIDSLIVDYIIAEARPLQTVETDSFRALIKGLQPKATVMSQKKLAKLISNSFDNFESSLKQAFSKVDTLCLTADLWSSQRRSFLGVTAHWIELDENNALVRKSAAIGIKRFTGKLYCKKIFATRTIINTFFQTRICYL